MDGVCPGDYVGYTTFMSHVIVLVDWFVMAVDERRQWAVRLHSKSTRLPLITAGYGGQCRLVKIRLGNGIKIFLLQSTRATGPVAATADICYIMDQKLLLLNHKIP